MIRLFILMLCILHQTHGRAPKNDGKPNYSKIEAVFQGEIDAHEEIDDGIDQLEEIRFDLLTFLETDIFSLGSNKGLDRFKYEIWRDNQIPQESIKNVSSAVDQIAIVFIMEKPLEVPNYIVTFLQILDQNFLFLDGELNRIRLHLMTQQLMGMLQCETFTAMKEIRDQYKWSWEETYPELKKIRDQWSVSLFIGDIDNIGALFPENDECYIRLVEMMEVYRSVRAMRQIESEFKYNKTSTEEFAKKYIKTMLEFEDDQLYFNSDDMQEIWKFQTKRICKDIHKQCNNAVKQAGFEDLFKELVRNKRKRKYDLY